MKSDGAMKHFILAFLLALVCYAIFYWTIEGRRTAKGPWQITFTNGPAGEPLVVINHPKLAIMDAQISFPELPTPAKESMGVHEFSQPKPVPFNSGFGKCVFMDTTFLPGTITFELYGHQVELLQRALVIDRQEHPWISGNTIILHPLDSEPAPPGSGSEVRAP